MQETERQELCNRGSQRIKPAGQSCTLCMTAQRSRARSVELNSKVPVREERNEKEQTRSKHLNRGFPLSAMSKRKTWSCVTSPYACLTRGLDFQRSTQPCQDSPATASGSSERMSSRNGDIVSLAQKGPVPFTLSPSCRARPRLTLSARDSTSVFFGRVIDT